MPRLIWVFAGLTYHFVGFVMRRLMYANSETSRLVLLEPSQLAHSECRSNRNFRQSSIDLWPYWVAAYRKIPKNSDTRNICCNHPKIWTTWLYNCEMWPKDVYGMANSVDPDQTPLGAVWSGSTLFALTCLSENLGTIRYAYLEAPGKPSSKMYIPIHVQSISFHQHLADSSVVNKILTKALTKYRNMETVNM